MLCAVFDLICVRYCLVTTGFLQDIAEEEVILNKMAGYIGSIMLLIQKAKSDGNWPLAIQRD
jgi:hypothetical protein